MCLVSFSRKPPEFLSSRALYSPAQKNPLVSIKLYVEEHHTATLATHLNGSTPALEHFSSPGWSSREFAACVQYNDPAALLSVPSLQNSRQPKYSGYTSESQWRLWNHTQGKNRTEGKKARAVWSTSQMSYLAWGIFILRSFLAFIHQSSAESFQNHPFHLFQYIRWLLKDYGVKQSAICPGYKYLYSSLFCPPLTEAATFQCPNKTVLNNSNIISTLT